VSQKGPFISGFFLVTIAATRDKKKSKRAVEDGFDVLIGPQKLTRFEKARIVGARSLQLAMGAPSFVPIDETIRDSIALAMMELASEALPISIRRSLPNGKSQDIPIKYLL
jgi:DNA-directed RNA polymerase I, II, and III subunit RPABC2